jgi:hypothetical protein
MPAAVVFAFGARPGIAPHEALDIAERLTAQPDSAAQSAAAKIRERAEADVSGDVELDAAELERLASVLDSMRSLTDFRASLGRLHHEVAAALGSGA